MKNTGKKHKRHVDPVKSSYIHEIEIPLGKNENNEAGKCLRN